MNRYWEWMLDDLLRPQCLCLLASWEEDWIKALAENRGTPLTESQFEKLEHIWQRFAR